MTSPAAPARSGSRIPPVSDAVASSVEAASIKCNNLVYTLQRQGAEVIVLSFGEAYFDLPPLPIPDLQDPALHHYSHSRGVPELRERVARYYRDRFGVDTDPDRELLITAGSKAAIHLSMMTALNPGDEVVMHEPLWVSYPEQAKLCHATPVRVPYTETVQDFERYLTDRTRLMIVNNPNNPRGSVLTQADLHYLSDLAHASGVYLLADEAYGDFARPQGFRSAGCFDPDKSHTIICNSLSKTFGLSGWRIGYAISNAEFIEALLKVNQHVITCAPTILQHQAARYFDVLLAGGDPQMRAVVAKRAQVAQYLDEVGLDYLDGNTTFYLFVSIAPTTLTSEDFSTRLLMEEHVSVVPGSGYGRSCDSFVRLSVGTTSLADIRAGIDRLKALVERTS
jgi:aspartate/methionine/tyrosine aminotransferase